MLSYRLYLVHGVKPNLPSISTSLRSLRYDQIVQLMDSLELTNKIGRPPVGYHLVIFKMAEVIFDSSRGWRLISYCSVSPADWRGLSNWLKCSTHLRGLCLHRDIRSSLPSRRWGFPEEEHMSHKSFLKSPTVAGIFMWSAISLHCRFSSLLSNRAASRSKFW